jgi:hypothetical protein
LILILTLADDVPSKEKTGSEVRMWHHWCNVPFFSNICITFTSGTSLDSWQLKSYHRGNSLRINCAA